MRRILRGQNINFVAITEKYKQKVTSLIGSGNNVFNVGALSIENIAKLKLISTDELFKKYKVDFLKKTILCTFHPETITFEKNEIHIKELLKALYFENYS